jgi:hypothetical protein
MKPKVWAISSVIAALGLVALGSWVIWTNPGPAPAPFGEPASAEKGRNWIWRPTLEDLEWAKTIEGGALHLRGPIVDEATGEPITGRVYINREFVAEAQVVAVLMWATVERPVFLRVEAVGYHPWELRFRFRQEGLGELKGPIRLKPASQEG